MNRKRFIYIDSGKRLSGTTSDFAYRIELDEAKYDMVSVMQLSVPYTYYLVQDGFNTFQLKEIDQSPLTITVPTGNYNINSFSSIIGTLLTTSSPSGATYTVTYPKSFTETNTAFLTLTVSGTTNPSLIFNANTSLNEQFGFSLGSTVTFDGTTLVSSNAVNFLVNRSLLLHSDIIDGGASNILQEIYSQNSQVNNNIVYQATDALTYAKPLKLGKTNTANFYLSDINGQRIDLNGQDLNMTLMFYESSKTTKIIESFIKMIAERLPLYQPTQPTQLTESLPTEPTQPTQLTESTEPTEPKDDIININLLPIDYKPNYPVNDKLYL